MPPISRSTMLGSLRSTYTAGCELDKALDSTTQVRSRRRRRLRLSDAKRCFTAVHPDPVRRLRHPAYSRHGMEDIMLAVERSASITVSAETSSVRRRTPKYIWRAGWTHQGAGGTTMGPDVVRLRLLISMTADLRPPRSYSHFAWWMQSQRTSSAFAHARRSITIAMPWAHRHMVSRPNVLS